MGSHPYSFIDEMYSLDSLGRMFAFGCAQDRHHFCNPGQERAALILQAVPNLLFFLVYGYI